MIAAVCMIADHHPVEEESQGLALVLVEPASLRLLLHDHGDIHARPRRWQTIARSDRAV